MGDFQRISTTDAFGMLQDESARLVDIRDEHSFAAARIAGALHLDNTTLQNFLRDADPHVPVIVYCYHGNSSQPAAAFLKEQGFETVYSMDGGFEQWRSQFPFVGS